MTLFTRQAKVNLHARMPTAQDSTAFSKGVIQAPMQWDETQEAFSQSRRVKGLRAVYPDEALLST